VTLLFLASALAAPSDPAPPPPEPAPVVAEAPPSTAVLTFDTALNVSSDLMLQGLAATQSVAFTVPRAWTLTADPVLDLVFDHSAVLDPARSTLTVRVNDRALATVRLDADNATNGKLSVRVPRALLAPYSRIQLDVVQHLSDTCEDPFDPGLWTRISNASTLTMPSKPSEEVLDLLAFPFPILDDRGYGPSRVALVESGSPLGSDLDVLGRLGLALGRLAGYRGVSIAPPVASVEALATNGLVVGIYGNDPVVTQLLGAPPPAETGVVAVLRAPHDPALSILVVAGADEKSLLAAAEALVGQDRSPVLSGGTARITSVTASTIPPLADAFRPVPRDRETVTLGELGLKDTTVRGYYAETVRVPLDFGGDARPRAGGTLRLMYAHSALVDPRLSGVEVRLNGVVLRSRHLDGEGGPTTLDVTLPAEIIEPQSQLEVAFTLFPDDFDPCRRVSDRPLWATVLATSALTVPLDRFAVLPDLSLFRHRYWPLELDAARGGASILLGSSPTADDASAALQLAAELGRTSPAETPSLQIRAGGTPSEFAGADIIVLAHAERPHAGWSALADAGQLTLTGDASRTLAETGGKLLSADVGTPYATVEGVRDGNRDVVALRAALGATLLDATQALLTSSRVAALSGNAAVLPDEGGARVLDVGTRTAVGKLSVTNRFQGWMRDGWGLMGLGVPAAALAAALLIGRWARRRGGTT